MSELAPVIGKSPARHVGAAVAPESPPDASGDETTALAIRFGANLRRLRVRNGHSLGRLAGLSGVSRTMLSQIENGRSAPSIVVAIKIANALGLSIQRLLDDQRRARFHVTRRGDVAGGEQDGPARQRPLNALNRDCDVTIEELRLEAGAQGDVVEVKDERVLHIVVARGEVHVRLCSGEQVLLLEGDSIAIESGSAHRVCNTGQQDAVLYSITAPRG